MEVRKKGWMNKRKKLMEPLDLDEEELKVGTKDIHREEVVLITQLPPYVPPRKSIAKVAKDPNSEKYKVFTPLLLEDVVVEGDLLAWVPFLKMEDWDLGDHLKFPLFEPKKYLKKVYYEESVFTRLEQMKWAINIEHVGLLNTLWVPKFRQRIINTIFVCQLLVRVHDGCLSPGSPIPNDDMLIHIITLLHYQGEDPVDTFVGKLQEKKLGDQMKSDFGMMKKSRSYDISSILDGAI